jgi:two-component system, OmpR family, sensor kinase
MSAAETPAGIALLCDAQGTILEVVRDELGLGERLAPGQSFTDIPDSESREKAGLFLATIRYQGAAFDWELNVDLGERLGVLHFAGGRTGERLLIVGAASPSAAAHVYEELMKISSEQMNVLRSAVKDLSLQVRQWQERDSHIYEEFSRVNNELANTQREMAKQNVELARLNEQKNQFIGMAAHDLRNPLSVILNFSQYMLRDESTPLAPQQREFIAIIERNSKFMLNLIHDILSLSRIESGRLHLDLQPVDLAALVAANVNLNRVLAEKKKIHLGFKAEDDLPPIWLDAAKIEQVMNNLISNALKFSHPHRTVEVSVTRTADTVQIAVKDEGQGIPADELDKIFKPFEKTSVKSTDGEQSTGLGLAIASRIVEGHAGWIAVESESGRGSTFTVMLPIRTQAHSA